jgi:hypothetical protein
MSAKADFFKDALQSFQEGKHFTAAQFLKAHILKSSTKTESKVSVLLNKIMQRTSIYPFLDLPLSAISSLTPSSSISYLYGKKLFFLKKDKESLVEFLKIKRNSSYYPHGLFHVASLYSIAGKMRESYKYIYMCKKSAKRQSFLNTPKALALRILENIGDRCENLRLRNLYKESKFKKMAQLSEKVDPQSYAFPVSLFEASWNSFRLEDYNRSVGKTLTFQAPMLEDYFISEVELVKVLSYLKLCDYQEVQRIIKNFNEVVKKDILGVISKFNLKDSKDYPALKIMFRRKLPPELKDSFITKLIDVLKVKPGMVLLTHFYKKLRKEKKLLKKSERKAYFLAVKSFTGFFNNYARLKFVGYSNQVLKISKIFSEISLDLISLQKYQIYDQKAGKLTKAKSQSFLVETNRRTNQYYWDFAGEFWADELGFYIPVLENKCLIKAKK